MPSSTFCGIGDPFAETFTTMFGVKLKKLKPRFGGGGGGSSETFEDNADDNLETKGAPCDETNDRQESFGQMKISEENKSDERVKMREATDTQDKVEEEEDLNQMLQEMSIPDFNLSLDFDSLESAQIDTTTDDDDSPTTGNDYSSRLKREEIFSKKYHPTIAEKSELEDLATHLGASSSRGIWLSASAECMHNLLFGNHSIILKRGPIDFEDNNCELILLTDGFVIAYSNFHSYNPLGSRYEACQFWSNVEFVENAKAGTLTIQLRSGESYSIHAVTDGENVKTWLEYTEHVLIQYAMRDSKLSSLTETLGWQYKLVRRPGYTAAVTGDMRLMGNPEKYLNQLDAYNESTPLHYALQQSPCSAQIVEALLRLGSDPNIPDGEDRTPMYFAQRNDMTDVEAILKEYGGKPSKLAETELRGELFGGVEHASRNNSNRREREQALKDKKAADAATNANSAQSEMSKAMSALVERGQKIEQMDDKARQLNDEAKTFSDLAKQLKGEMKNKKWYQL